MLGKEPIAFAKVAIEIMLPELMTKPAGLLMGQRSLTADRAMREIAHMRATIAAMRKPVLARYRSAMMTEALSRFAMMSEALSRSAMVGQALRCRTRVSNVTGVREMSGAPRMDAARVDRATMRAADVTDMHSATVTEMRAAAVSGKTAKMRRPTAEMHAAAAKVRCTTAAKVGRATAKVHATTTAAEMRCTTAAKVHAATAAAEMRCTTAAKVRAATAKVGAATTATEMRRGNCERKSGNAEPQSGRQSNNNPMRHSTTPTI